MSDRGGDYQRELIGVGYTIATGRLFCTVERFHAHAEAILGRSILTHEFADERTWKALRDAFEHSVMAAHEQPT